MSIAGFISNDATRHTIINECMKIHLQCQDIKSEKDSVSFFVQNHQVIISTKKSLTEQMSSLQLTIHQLTMEGKDFSGLDFRYDRPVISY